MTNKTLVIFQMCARQYIRALYIHILTGLFCIIPCTDDIVKIDLRIVSFDVPPQEVYFSFRHFPSLSLSVSLYQINVKNVTSKLDYY